MSDDNTTAEYGAPREAAPETATQQAAAPESATQDATPGTTAGTTARVTRPHIRWAGVVWGVILIAVSAFVLYTVASPSNHFAFSYWLSHLTPGSGWTLVVVAAGVVILVLALLAAVRSAQRKRRA
ncbi:hypothetical protein ACFVWR_11755 [Leifsonia sp. NPDC058292]|uniref:hypothetical protein n=1 Tax=Leifsonia sp. NPDC058292 TaxID=3346428 RepID=UPI0036D95321